MTTENTLQHQNTKTKIEIKTDNLDEVLNICKSKFGHRHSYSWWWKPKKRFKDKIYIFTFANESDALLFKLLV